MPLGGAKPGRYYATIALVILVFVSLKSQVVYPHRPDVVLVAVIFLASTLLLACVVGIFVLNRWHAAGWRNYLHLLSVLMCLAAGAFTWQYNWNPGGQVRKPAPYRDWDKPLTDRADIEAYRYAHRLEIPDPYRPDGFFREGWLGLFGRTTRLEYIEHLCNNVAGEFIYRSIDGVDSVAQLRPRLEPAEKLGDRYALEDPYAYRQVDSAGPHTIFVGSSGYAFYESRHPLVRTSAGQSYPVPLEKVMRQNSLINRPDLNYTGFRLYERRIARPKPAHLRTENGIWVTEQTAPRSRYAYTWRGIRIPHAREYGIAGSELIIVDLETDSILAVRRGIKAASLTTGSSGVYWEFGYRCPDPSGGRRFYDGDRYFVSKVLKPTGSRKADEPSSNPSG